MSRSVHQRFLNSQSIWPKTFLLCGTLSLGLLTLTGEAAQAQVRSGTISGSVVSEATNQALPGATIQIEGQYVGTIANEDGDFSIYIADFPVTLIVRFIGYRSSIRTFRSAPSDPVRFALSPSRLDLPEIVISGENPAVNIMRRVIEEKQRWRESFETYRVNAYNRFRMENDTGIVSIWESSTLAFWDKERGIREISLAQKQTANTEIDELLPAALFMNNLYDDDVEVAGHTIMGVTNKDALSYYDFSLSGTRAIDEHLVYDIDVKPRSKLGSGFIGSVAVLDSVFALLSVELEPGASFLFPPPIKNLTVRYRQQFSRFGSDVWLPVDLRSTVALDISFGGLLSFPTFYIRQFTRLSDFELNVALPDSLYESHDIVVADSMLISKLEIAKLEDLAIPLTANEVTAYETIDSTMTLEKSFRPRGLLARFVNVSAGSSERDDGRARSRGGGIQSRSLIAEHVDMRLEPATWYNQVEGLHVGGSLALEIESRIRLTGRAGYQTARKGWTYGGDLRIGRRTWIGVGFLDHVPRRYGSDIQGRFLNSLSVLSSRPDYFDYLHERTGYVSIGTRIPWWRAASAQVTFSDSRHDNEIRNISRGLIGSPDVFIPNSEIDAGTLQSIFLRLSYQEDSVPFGIGGQYTARIDVERSVGGTIVEDGYYTRIGGVVVWRIPTFYRRRLLPNTLDFKLTAGTFSGHLPRQRWGTIDGSAILTTFGGLRTRRERPYEGESYVAFMAEHSFRTILFERLGLQRLVRYGWNLILTGAVARTWISDQRIGEYSDLAENPQTVHSELGVSLSGLFGLVRIDYTRRMDASGYSIGIAVARMF
ncbi:MAG: DUF5686 and carboxypeptidase-like regulatory domain-containing protein [Rhodothermia bacterium]|nr:MAG: DUF5686 and carboxypeptidase-like regulatory domain-containing protein [Rhodothermia bacterium]